jgi:hypothetical protein
MRECAEATLRDVIPEFLIAGICDGNFRKLFSAGHLPKSFLTGNNRRLKGNQNGGSQFEGSSHAESASSEQGNEYDYSGDIFAI